MERITIRRDPNCLSLYKIQIKRIQQIGFLITGEVIYRWKMIGPCAICDLWDKECQSVLKTAQQELAAEEYCILWNMRG